MIVASGLEEKHMKHCRTSIQASGGSLMIWGCLCWAGPGSASVCNIKIEFSEYMILSYSFSGSFLKVMTFFKTIMLGLIELVCGQLVPRTRGFIHELDLASPKS
ncbi:hypothetical protein AVEN_262294-1 [Araneus ventricosus]|uniref:Uncharacterized protein n=1 Tax=Araneus ventricosus TaxID=182803 RepID=A0A4Y2N106_ARAVE|nr:hypothetical protein AVEN_222253-1 [Araneus ventricosus]GBN32304.1 hypothetical protein AVEN_262294-1 [Araneus ventricosus]